MTTHRTRSLHITHTAQLALRIAGATLLIALLAATTARALSLNEPFFQAGIGIGKIKGDAHDADMTTYSALYNHVLHEGGIIALDARASYTYGDVTSDFGGSMQDSDADLILSLPKIPIVKPFVIAGLSYDKFNVGHNFGPEYGWDFGYNLGIGAEVKALPNLPITGSVRYTHGDIERITYLLDATFWFTKIGVGANITYQTGEGDFDNNITQGNVYVTISF